MIDDNSKEFIKRHIGPSDEEQSKMLQYVGYKSLEDLMSNTVPEKILLKDGLKIDQPMSENDALKKLKSIIKGIIKGCKLSQCELVGGETAEMPGTYEKGKFDIAGFAVGIAGKDKILSKYKIKNNDLVLAIPSSGLHSNGYSLVRYLLKQKKINIKKNKFLKKELIKPTKIYVKEVLKLIDKNLINGCANITGGGLADNIKRVIPDNLTAEINLKQIKTLKIFKWLNENGISDKEMLKTFNCGVGFCLIINPKKLNQIKKYFTNNFEPYVIGKISKKFKDKVKLNGSVNWI